MDNGDVQIVTESHAYQDEVYDEEFRFLSILSQSNFSRDTDVLRFVSGASDPILFTFSKAEDGTVNIVDTVFAQDGEDWMDSFKAMGETVGCSTTDIRNAVDLLDYCVICDLISYMDEHEDITGIEYKGEIRSREDLDAVLSETLDKFSPETEADTEAFGPETEAE